MPPIGVQGGVTSMDGQSDPLMLQPAPYPPNAFHRPFSQQQSQQQAQQLLRNSAKLPNVCSLCILYPGDIYNVFF